MITRFEGIDTETLKRKIVKLKKEEKKEMKKFITIRPDPMTHLPNLNPNSFQYSKSNPQTNKSSSRPKPKLNWLTLSLMPFIP